jgi:ZIP family zinc transporter
MLLAIGLLTGLATVLGGTLALRLQTSLGLFLGFGAGAVLGVALFDLLPEALALGVGAHSVIEVMAALACGFAAYLVIDQTVFALARRNRWRGQFGAAALTGHSLMDGLGIGLAFEVSPTVGAIVAVAVLAHDCLDGANTVSLTLSGGAGDRAARRWLIADALAPLVGIGLSRLVAIPQATLAIVLAAFAGFFLYIGATEMLPHALERRPRASTAMASLAGLALMYLVVRLSAG